MVYAELMGGYGKERQENPIYVHGKKDDGRDDFKDKFTIDFEDRNNEDILETIGEFCFYTVGLEKDQKGKTVYKKFLTPYDMIKYISEVLENDMIINVKGNLKYSVYNDRLQVRKELRSVVLSRVEKESDFKAMFKQTVLLDRDSVNIKNIDKDKESLMVDAYVVDYDSVKKTNTPYAVTFEYKINMDKLDIAKAIVNKLFKVKENITEITFNGEFIEGAALIQTTYEDLEDDIKELVDCGAVGLDEALSKCTVNGSKERRMLLTTPDIKMEEKDEKTFSVLQKFENKYTEEDLLKELAATEVIEEESDTESSQEVDSTVDVSNDDELLSFLKGVQD